MHLNIRFNYNFFFFQELTFLYALHFLFYIFKVFFFKFLLFIVLNHILDRQLTYVLFHCTQKLIETHSSYIFMYVCMITYVCSVIEDRYDIHP